MADRENELVAAKESNALKKLQALAGVAEKGTTERLDWMYEQSTASKSDLEKLNAPVSSETDKDMADVKALQTSTAGSLFLKGSTTTRTSEDMLRKLREDPLFQIRREEQAAKESMLQNPLIQARLKKKQEKASKKDSKKQKKLAKKEKKAMKKAKKAAKKATKSSSDSSDSSAGSDTAAKAPNAPIPKERARSRSRGRADPNRDLDIKALGPNVSMVSAREERAARVEQGKVQALASRGACQRMSEEEKKRRLEQMSTDAKSHDAYKNKRIEIGEKYQKDQDEQEAKARATSDQKYFRDMRQQVYMEEGAGLEDRLKNQRHKRQKGLNDTLE